LRTVLQAPVLATKGHYYQIADEAKDKIATIIDLKGDKMTPEISRDETTMGIEQITGVNMLAEQRLQMNFQVKRDSLFNFLQKDYFITPLTFVQRDSVMT
jgi:CD36 family